MKNDRVSNAQPGGSRGRVILAPEAGAEKTTHEARFLSAGLKAGLWLAAALVGGVVAYGCGHSGGERSGAASAGEASMVEPVDQTVYAASAGMEASQNATLDETQEAVEDTESRGETSVKPLPPEIAALVSEQSVTPGQTVEFTAMTTEDAAEVILWDGRREKQVMDYDPASNRWHAEYRVPLRNASDRIGISLTARSELNRWRRVWVFLTLEPQTAHVVAPSPDSTVEE